MDERFTAIPRLVLKSRNLPVEHFFTQRGQPPAGGRAGGPLLLFGCCQAEHQQQLHKKLAVNRILGNLGNLLKARSFGLRVFRQPVRNILFNRRKGLQKNLVYLSRSDNRQAAQYMQQKHHSAPYQGHFDHIILIQVLPVELPYKILQKFKIELAHIQFTHTSMRPVKRFCANCRWGTPSSPRSGCRLKRSATSFGRFPEDDTSFIGPSASSMWSN